MSEHGQEAARDIAQRAVVCADTLMADYPAALEASEGIRSLLVAAYIHGSLYGADKAFTASLLTLRDVL